MKKTILKTCFCILLGLAFWLAVGLYIQSRKIPTIREFQKQIGAVPDGKLGRETQAKWQIAWQKQNKGKLMY